MKGLRFMDDKIRTLSNYRLQKAREDLEAARLTFQHQKLAQSVNRSYYAIFHAVRALVATITLIQKGTQRLLVTLIKTILQMVR